MQKNITFAVVVALVLVGGFFIVNGLIYQEKQAEFTPGDTVSISGEVLAVDTSAAAVDGPVLVNVQTKTGPTTVAVPSMGLLLCEAHEKGNMADAYTLEVGDKVEVRGVVSEDGAVVPCESAEHYLRLKNSVQFSDPDLGLKFSYKTGGAGYVLRENEPSEDQDWIALLMLVHANDVDHFENPPEGGEGPAVISIQVFPNAKEQQARAWADANPQLSNINLVTGEVSEAVVGGANAIRYMADGLYPFENYIVAHGENIYVFSGAYTDEDSALRQDFTPIVNSVRFIPQPGQE